jgi:phospholipid N-methyltransferase
MELLAPGNILQNLYFTERINKLKPKTFCEIGSGNGHLSKILLNMGLTGKGYDLNESACDNNRLLNKEFIDSKKYAVYNEDFLSNTTGEKYDFIFSCMVIEHLDEDLLNKYFDFCKKAVTATGTIAVFVPANMTFWNIEDIIAGHFKRYSFQDFRDIAGKHKLVINDMAGLNYPISNWLFALSNKLVKKSEGYKENLSMQEQTILSGNRDIKFKTKFPWYTAIVLNKVAMYPFHILQKMNRNNEKSQVIYCEFKNA